MPRMRGAPVGGNSYLTAQGQPRFILTGVNSIVTATGTSYGIYANSYNNCDIRGKDTVIKATSTGGELAVYSQYPTAYYPYYGSINLYDDLCVTVSLHS